MNLDFRDCFERENSINITDILKAHFDIRNHFRNGKTLFTNPFSLKFKVFNSLSVKQICSIVPQQDDFTNLVEFLFQHIRERKYPHLLFSSNF